MSEIKNKPASVQAKLKKIAKENGIDYNSILILYMQERFLYRLSVSPFADNFLLKGGLLLFCIDKFNTRPTVDMDFLAYKIQNRRENLIKIISEIGRTRCGDGLFFRTDDITIETILEHGLYRGVRAGITCTLGNVRNRLRIDIGFGDVVIPKPAEIVFPILLETEEIPVIKAYSLESSIAEKFEAMIKLSFLNSRMKDFYDIYTLSKRKTFEGRVLQEAIFQTFQRRKTPFERNQPIFQELFINSDEKQREWSNFEKRIRVISPKLFKDVMNQIKAFLQPIFESICNEEEFFLYWDPTKNQWLKNKGI
ncbi:MAG: hypothetical protein VR69_10485 [Peptococcaceae bacterium BRH_c4b]|nr:MAG: hypothetical protein VR69_10485 [Peptococcaceae bacterium BRH_c4b]